jgi:hypothetical protein
LGADLMVLTAPIDSQIRLEIVCLRILSESTCTPVQVVFIYAASANIAILYIVGTFYIAILYIVGTFDIDILYIVGTFDIDILDIVGTFDIDILYIVGTFVKI